MNELPLRHLIETIDGKFHGPEAFSGPIGKVICKSPDKWLDNIVQFKKVKLTKKAQPIMDAVKDSKPEEYLNEDQLYFYKLWVALSKGNETLGKAHNQPKELWERYPSKVHLARWANTAAAMARLYAQKHFPSDNLQYLINYIVNVYAPMFFIIKVRCHITMGARLYFLGIQLSKECLPKRGFKFVKKYFEINSYYGHPESVLLSAVYDDRKDVRERAVRRIIDLREYWNDHPNHFRQFKLLNGDLLDYDAKHYADLIKWENLPLEEYADPPMLRNYSIPQLWRHADQTEPIYLPNVPVHSQAVERAVQRTSLAATTCIGYENRHAKILALIEDREKTGKDAKKSDYKN